MTLSIVSDTRAELHALARIVAEDPARRTFAFELVPLIATADDSLRLFDCLTEAVAEQEALHNDPRSYLEARDFPLRSVDRIADSLAGNVEGLLDQLTAGAYVVRRYDLAEPDERTDENACPECDIGVVVEVGPQCRETGHVPIACSKNCGWTS